MPAFIYSAMKSAMLSNARMNVYRTFERAAAKYNRQFVSDTAWRYGICSTVAISQAIIERRRRILTSEIRSVYCDLRKIIIHLILRKTSVRRGAAIYNATSRMSRNK